jgi:glycosyltransferase involved in cell wall biosynthesis
MRIVILYNSSWYVFLLRQNLIAALQAAGHHVVVIAPEDGYTARVKQLGVEFLPINMRATGRSPLFEAWTLRSVYHAIRGSKPNVVLSFTVKCNLYAGLCRRILDFRHVANVSGLGELFDGGFGVGRGVYQLYRIALKRTEVVFFQNRDDKARLLESGAVDGSRAQLIPGSGVDLARFVPIPRAVRRQRAFLMFGRLLPKKGFDSFLDAARQLRTRHADSASFWILGAPDQTREESMQLLERIEQAHAEGAIRYLHSTDDPIPYIREADVVVLPSTYNEGVPRSLLEALACGKPVVTTDWKGCRETVEHGKNGLLVRPDDTSSLVDALESLVRCDAQLLEQYGHASRRLAEERFDEQLVLEAYHRAVEPERAYQSLKVVKRVA